MSEDEKRAKATQRHLDRRSLYESRDPRIKCTGCRRWMRIRPKPGDGYATRRRAPVASHCTDCKLPERLVRRLEEG